MKKDQVQIGKAYWVKVSGSVAPVRLEKESQYGGWEGTNILTGRTIRIRTAAKLRREYGSAQPTVKKYKKLQPGDAAYESVKVQQQAGMNVCDSLDHNDPAGCSNPNCFKFNHEETK